MPPKNKKVVKIVEEDIVEENDNVQEQPAESSALSENDSETSNVEAKSTKINKKTTAETLEKIKKPRGNPNNLKKAAEAKKKIGDSRRIIEEELIANRAKELEEEMKNEMLAKIEKEARKRVALQMVEIVEQSKSKAIPKPATAKPQHNQVQPAQESAAAIFLRRF